MINNLAQIFFQNAQSHPNKTALIFSSQALPGSNWSESKTTYGEMQDQCRLYMTGLQSRGFRAGHRIIWLAPLSPETYIFTISCVALGIVPVFVESGLSLSKMRSCLRKAKGHAIVSSQRLFDSLWAFPELWMTPKYSVDLAKSSFQRFWIREFSDLKSTSDNPAVESVKMSEDDLCLLTFTTGSTGAPKAAQRTFKILLEQHHISKRYWPDIAEEVDMPVFPNIVFQNLLCGISTVLPSVNFSAVGDVDPRLICHQISKHRVTRISSSPTFILKVSKFMISEKIEFPTIRSLIVGGAPVSKKLAGFVGRAFPNSENFVVYGSTEAEPISFIKLEKVAQQVGAGYLVGHPLPELKVALLSPALSMETIKIQGFEKSIDRSAGEVFLSGRHVVTRYFENETATAETKTTDSTGAIWHRTGDLGYWNQHGDLVLTGRAKDTIKTPLGEIPSSLIESELEHLSFVERAGVHFDGRTIKVFLTASETASGIENSDVEIMSVLNAFKMNHASIHWLEKMPVDPRHNSKIDRKSLSSLAERSK